MAKQTGVGSGGGGGLPATIQQAIFSMRLFNAERDLPIVYSDNYNISLVGVELTHSFDTKKYAKLAKLLTHNFMDTPFARVRYADELKQVAPNNATGGNNVNKAAISDDSRRRRLRFLQPNRPVNKQELAWHHKQSYIDQAHANKSLIAQITEAWALHLVPQFALESRLLAPIKWQISGTLFAGCLALQHGWAINLGGGFHTAHSAGGETFCIFSDIMLLARYVWRRHPNIRLLCVDLDAHQATGLALDLAELDARRRKMVYLLDVYNNTIQPVNERANKATDQRVELGRFTGDETYLAKLDSALKQAFDRFKPNLVVYVAGQDVLLDDQLGMLNLSDDGLKKRDELVFTWAVERRKCPIVMLLGGGYLARGPKLFADSVRSLFARGLIWGGFRSGSRTLSRPRPPQQQQQQQQVPAPQNQVQPQAGQQQVPGEPANGEQHAVCVTPTTHVVTATAGLPRNNCKQQHQQQPHHHQQQHQQVQATKMQPAQAVQPAQPAQPVQPVQPAQPAQQPFSTIMPTPSKAPAGSKVDAAVINKVPYFKKLG